MLAAHNPGGFDLEEYYDQELYHWDAVGVMLEGMEDPEAKQLLAQMESETIYRTPLARHSAARHALVEAYLLQHPFYKAAVERGVYADIHLAAKRIRYGATKALLQQERAIQKKELTADEIEKRREELKEPSHVFALVHAHMKDRDAALGSVDEEVFDEDEDVADLFREAGAMESTDLRDIDDRLGLLDDSDTGTLTEDVGTDYASEDVTEQKESVDFLVEDDEMPNMRFDYAGAASAFMVLMLTYVTGKFGELCMECQLDPSVDAEMKSKRYSVKNLSWHIKGAFHYPITKWDRTFRQQEDCEQGEIECPYGCGRKYKNLTVLKGHLGRPYNPAQDSDEHERLKTEAGWYSAEFYGTRLERPKKTKTIMEEAATDARYDSSIKELEGRTAGRWAGLPAVEGLVEFGREATADALALASVPAAFLTTDAAAASGPAMHRTFGNILLSPSEVSAASFLSPAAQGMVVPLSERKDRPRDFYIDATRAYETAQRQEMAERRDVEQASADVVDADEMDVDEDASVRSDGGEHGSDDEMEG
ncbi:hypothetical protein LTR15_008194 [Elasticomyces elasticus]|nr:hypothetical protein LTR15_008194 [Elasticomyces elasticus]